MTAEPAHPDATSAPAAIGAIDRAVEDVLGGRAAAIVVTAPVAKARALRAGLQIPATPNSSPNSPRSAAAPCGRS